MTMISAAAAGHFIRRERSGTALCLSTSTLLACPNPLTAICLVDGKPDAKRRRLDIQLEHGKWALQGNSASDGCDLVIAARQSGSTATQCSPHTSGVHA